MKRLIYILPALGFLVLAAVLYRSLFTAPTILPSVLINQPAPKLTLPALDAQTQGFGPAQLAAGHVSVINVFGSWCAECHIEAPVLMQLGTREIVLSDSVRLYQGVTAAGGTAILDIYEGMPHVFMGYMKNTPEQKTAFEREKAFWAAHLVQRAKAG